MKSSGILISTMVMFSTNVMMAQDKKVNAIRWEIVASIPASTGHSTSLGLAGPVTGVHQNVLMVAGGANFPGNMPWQGGKKKYYDELYVFKREKHSVVIHPVIFKLPAEIAYAACCSTPQGILYAGGENDLGISNKVTLLQWDPMVENIIIKELPCLPVALTNAAATINENRVYVAGGETSLAATNNFYSLDLNNTAAGWQLLPAVLAPVSHAVLVTQSNGTHENIYLIGGRRKNTNGISDLYATVYEFDLVNGVWKKKKSLPYSLCAGTGIAAGADRILLFGGDSGATFHKVETLIAAIGAEKDEAKRNELMEQKNKLQAEHPGFSKEILAYNTNKDEWVKSGMIPFETPVTTTASKWGKDIIIPGGEIKAGVRTPNIILGKFK